MDFSTMRVTDRQHDDRNEKLIDLRRVFATMRQRQWWIISTMLLVLALTALAYVVVPRLFTASASIALDRRVDDLVIQGAQLTALPTDSPSVDTAVQVLTSPTLAGEVVDALGLATRSGFGQQVDGPPVPLPRARTKAIQALVSGLQVKRIGTSYAITVSYTASDPEIAAAIVNKTADQYIADQRNGKGAQRSREADMLADRLDSLRAEVIRAETAEARYRGATNLIDVTKDSTAVQQEISVLNTELAQAQADQAIANGRLSAFQANGGGGDNAAVSPVMRDLRVQQAQLSAQRAELAGRYGPLHPDLAKIDRQLNDVNRNIDEQSRRVRANLQADAHVAAERTGAIRASLNRAQSGLSAGNRASVQLNELQRNAESARGLYQSLLDRYKQAVAGEGTEQSNAYIIAHALVSNQPSFPTLIIFGAAGCVAAVLAAAGIVLTLELLERGFKSRHDLESALGLPVMANIPDMRRLPGVRLPAKDPMGPADYLVANEGSVLGEAFRSIRTALRVGREDALARSVAVCSALPGEGKTTVAICLARSAALAGRRVVLVDCDMRRRSSSRSVASGVTTGLVDVLRGQVQLEQALTRDEASGAWILPQVEGANDFDLIASTAMQTLIGALSREFDLVVLDTAPVLPLAEARAVAGMADATLLVTRWRKTPAHAAHLAVDMLGRAGAHVLGAVLSIVDLRHQSRAGEGDEMSYYGRFQDYYV